MGKKKTRWISKEELDSMTNETKQFGGQKKSSTINPNGNEVKNGMGFMDNSLYQMHSPNNDVNQTIQPTNNGNENVEIEKGEQVALPLSGGRTGTYTAGGKRHSEGGTPVNLPSGSFIYSDTSAMKDENGRTPADLAKKYKTNKLQEIISNPDSDKIQIQSAKVQLSNYEDALAKLAIEQEAKKGLPDGIPAISKPYLEKIGINENQLLDHNQQDMNISPTKSQTAKYGAEVIKRLGAMQKGGQQVQLQSQIAQMLSQNTDPQQVVQALITHGIKQNKAMKLVQGVIAQMQQGNNQPQGGMQPQSRFGGERNPMEKYPINPNGPFGMDMDFKQSGEYKMGGDYQCNPNGPFGMYLDFKQPGSVKEAQFGMDMKFNQPSTYQDRRSTSQMDVANKLYQSALSSKDPKFILDAAQKLEDTQIPKSLTFIPGSDQSKVASYANHLRRYASEYTNENNSNLFNNNAIPNLFHNPIDYLATQAHLWEANDRDNQFKLHNDSIQYEQKKNALINQLQEITNNPNKYTTGQYRDAQDKLVKLNDIVEMQKSPKYGNYQLPEQGYKGYIEQLRNLGITNTTPQTKTTPQTNTTSKSNNQDLSNPNDQIIKPESKPAVKVSPKYRLTPEQQWELEVGKKFGGSYQEGGENIIAYHGKDAPTKYTDDQWSNFANQVGYHGTDPSEFQLYLAKHPTFGPLVKQTNQSAGIPEYTGKFIDSKIGKRWDPIMDAFLKQQSITQTPTTQTNIQTNDSDNQIPQVQDINLRPYSAKGDYWTQDINNSNLALQERFGIKKYNPWAAPLAPTTQVHPTLQDPTRELASIAEMANIGITGAGMFGSPQELGARISQISGQAADQIANTLGRVNNTNVGTSNQFAERNASALDRDAEARQKINQNLYNEQITGNQQYDNAIRMANRNMISTTNSALTNRGTTQSMNTRYPQYSIDPRTGFTTFNGGIQFNPNQPGIGGGFSAKEYADVKAIVDQYSEGLTPEQKAKHVVDLLRSRSFQPVEQGSVYNQGYYPNMGYPGVRYP